MPPPLDQTREPTPGVGPEREAAALVTAHALIGLQGPEAAVAALDAQLGKRFQGASAPSS